MSATWQRRQRETPSFVARRQQHLRFTATAAVALPSEPGRSGGIVAFQNETQHFYMGVRREGASASSSSSARSAQRPEARRRRSLDSRFPTRQPAPGGSSGYGSRDAGAYVGLHARLEP